MRLPTISGEFRAGGDPELRFTPGGKAVANLSVIATESRKNQQTDTWEDGDSTPWLSVSLWDRAAEALAESGIGKGDRVLVQGQLFVREYEKRDGTKGQSMEVKNAIVAKVPDGKPGAGGGVAYGQQQQRQPAPDPWANTNTVPRGNAADPWGAPGSVPASTGNRDAWAPKDEPPF